MICPKCQSAFLVVIPAEIRLYRNRHRTLSHPPVTPSPDITVCLDCGWSEFAIPRAWLAGGWLRSMRSEAVPAQATTTSEKVLVLSR